MYQRLSLYDFERAIHDHYRWSNFASYDFVKALYDYLEDMEEQTGQPYELDVIALCCDLSVMSADEIVSDCGLDIGDADPIEYVRGHLADNTSIVAEIEGDFMFFNF